MIESLKSRASAQRLTEPGPTPAEIETILEASVTAPDHGRIRPWRFIVMRGHGRERFGALIGAALRHKNPNATDDEVARETGKPLRAPVIVAVVATPDHTHKIPVLEQILAAAAAGTQLMLAANALGYGVAWKSGAAAHDPFVTKGLGFSENDTVIGYFYLGTDPATVPPLPRATLEGIVQHWD